MNSGSWRGRKTYEHIPDLVALLLSVDEGLGPQSILDMFLEDSLVEFYERTERIKFHRFVLPYIYKLSGCLLSYF